MGLSERLIVVRRYNSNSSSSDLVAEPACCRRLYASEYSICSNIELICSIRVNSIDCVVRRSRSEKFIPIWTNSYINSLSNSSTCNRRKSYSISSTWRCYSYKSSTRSDKTSCKTIRSSSSSSNRSLTSKRPCRRCRRTYIYVYDTVINVCYPSTNSKYICSCRRSISSSPHCSRQDKSSRSILVNKERCSRKRIRQVIKLRIKALRRGLYY